VIELALTRKWPIAVTVVAQPHVCRWGATRWWTPPSSYQTGPSAEWPLRDAVPYRECACGETVWGDRVDSAYVLDNLIVRIADTGTSR
jgi:hypothetical protein